MRILSHRSLRGHRPFNGTGASLYIGSGSPDPGPESVLFRRHRLARGRFLQGPESTIGDTGVNKTARVASVNDPTDEIPYTLPAGLASQTVYVQVRTFKDDVENETNFRPLRMELDGSLEDATAIHGTALLLDYEPLAGGIVRIRFVWIPARTGVQPTQFVAVRTAGPTSPANATVAATLRGHTYEIDTPALSDSAPYTYKIRAENGATTLDVLTGIAIQADATGPTAPTSGTASPS